MIMRISARPCHNRRIEVGELKYGISSGEFLEVVLSEEWQDPRTLHRVIMLSQVVAVVI